MIVYRIESKRGVGPYKKLHNKSYSDGSVGDKSLRYGCRTLDSIEAWFGFDPVGMSTKNPLGIGVYRISLCHIVSTSFPHELQFKPDRAVRVAWIPLPSIAERMGWKLPRKFQKRAV